MKDCEGTELVRGQKVVVFTQAGLLRGTVDRIRMAKRYNRQLEVVRVVYDKPQQVFRNLPITNPEARDRWDENYYVRDADNQIVYETVLTATNRQKEFSDSKKILALDNPAN